MGCRLFLVLCLAGAAGCASHDSGAIEVEVQIASTVPSDCITVAAWNAPGQESTANFPRGSATQYKAAIYPGNGLSGTVTVVARGFTGSCGANLSALSAQTSATFNDPAPLVTLVLEPASCTACDGGGGDGGDGGGGGDGGPPPDGGGTDAGVDSGSPDGGGGSDGGADSGSDAGGGDDGGCHGADAGEPCGFGWGLCAEDSTCVENFPFPPSNFTRPYPPISPPIVLNCGKSYIDTTGPGQAPNFTNWCGNPLPGWLDATQGGGAATAVVLAMSSFELVAGSQLIVDGGRSVILAVFGDAGVDGTLFAGGAGAYSGPGANSAACGLGENGQIASGTGANNPGSGGGGGGGLGTAGAPGGQGNNLNNGGPGGDGGALSGTSTLQPLVAGCSGGDGGLSPNQSGFGMAGGGGGAVQVTAANVVTVNNTVTAPGGGGGPGGGNTGNRDGPGAGGGGSGGAILLEASNVIIHNAHLTANGGAGGGGGDDNNVGAPGNDGATGNATVANGGGGGGAGGNGGKGGAGATLPTAGSQANNSWGSGGGGGGAVGRIWLRAADGGCTINGSAVSPPATSNGAPGCP